MKFRRSRGPSGSGQTAPRRLPESLRVPPGSLIPTLLALDKSLENIGKPKEKYNSARGLNASQWPEMSPPGPLFGPPIGRAPIGEIS